MTFYERLVGRCVHEVRLLSAEAGDGGSGAFFGPKFSYLSLKRQGGGSILCPCSGQKFTDLTGRIYHPISTSIIGLHW